MPSYTATPENWSCIRAFPWRRMWQHQRLWLSEFH